MVSLIAKGNKTLRPTVDASKCLREKGQAECHLCYEACPEAIDLHNLAAGAPLNECMKCRECVGACSTGAISFPLMPAKTEPGTQVVRINASASSETKQAKKDASKTVADQES